jgi:hypothetical protein
VIAKLAILSLILAVAARIHITLWVAGCQVATPSALQLGVVAAYLLAAVSVWVAARSVMNRPILPRPKAMAW